MIRIASVLAGLLLGALTVTATDLTVSKLIFPLLPVQVGQAVNIKFQVDNLNVLAATEYNIEVTVTRKSTTTLVFSETVSGIPIAPYTQKEHTTEGKWLATQAGEYDIKFKVNFADDINLSNNTTTFAAMAAALQLNATLLYLNWLSPFLSRNINDAELRVTFDAATKWRYFNVLVATSNTLAAWWVVQNLLIPPFLNQVSYSVPVDLYDVLLGETKMPDSVFAHYSITDNAVVTRSELPQYATNKVSIESTDVSVSNGARDSTKVSITTAPPPVVTNGSVVRDSVYYGCMVPNIDLDSSAHNPTNTPGYAGDKNACAPTAAANSMQWLENSFSNVRSGLNHRQKLEALSECMKRADNTGVWVEDFIKGKLCYINKFNLPIKVKFQVRGLTKNVSTWHDDDYESTAENMGDGKYPKFDFVKKELQDSEDVEVFVEFHNQVRNSSTVVGRHVIVATGAAKMDDYDRFWYKDDKNQRRAGGTVETPAYWAMVNDSVPYIESKRLTDSTRRFSVPYAVVSESPDPNYKRTEKGFFEHLRDGAVGLAGRYEHGAAVDWKKSHPIRFSHLIFNRGSVTKSDGDQVQAFTPLWVVKNMPIGDVFGAGTYSLLDQSMLGITGTTVPTDVEVRVLYTDKPVTTMPTFDSTYRKYPLPQINGASLGGSINGMAGTEMPPASGIISTVPMPDGNAYSVTRSSVVSDFNQTLLDRVSDQQIGASAVSGFNAVVDLLGKKYPGSVTTQNSFVKTADAMKYTSAQKGTTRSDVLLGILSTIDENKWLISAEFQSIRLPAGDIISPVLATHSAKNVSVAPNGLDYSWMYNSLNSRVPLMVELGWYDANTRVKGTWVTVYGMVEHNGLRRVLMPIDVDEEHPGGLRWTVATLAEADGFLYLPELSTALSRCHVETVVSLKYDPTLVFTGVAEDLAKEVYDITVMPQPASDMLTVKWAQVFSQSAAARIINSVGETVAQFDVRGLGDGFEWNIQTSSFATGMYTLVIQTQHTVVSKKIMIVRQN